MKPGQEKAFREIQRRGEELKEHIWSYLDLWTPEDTSIITDLKSATNELLDQIDMLEDHE
jgi:hypothetical protein